MKKISFFFILFIFIKNYSQETFINGVITDKIGRVTDAHIINETSGEGTFSDDNGNFSIKASLNDILKISSIQHHTQKLTVANITLKTKELAIKLFLKDYLLREVTIKKHTLNGILNRDFKQTPDDVAFVKSKGALDFSMIDFEKSIILNDDNIEKSKVDVTRKTDPTQSFEGVRIFKIPLFTRKKDKRLAQRIAKDNFEDQLSNKIISLIGKNVFIKNYKIPEDNIHLFIRYAIDQNIKELIDNNRILTLIEELKRKSIIYHKEINENK